MSTNNWTALMDHLHQRHREDEHAAQELARRVRAQLLAEHSKFMEDFSDAELRAFGVNFK